MVTDTKLLLNLLRIQTLMVTDAVSPLTVSALAFIFIRVPITGRLGNTGLIHRTSEKPDSWPCKKLR